MLVHALAVVLWIVAFLNIWSAHFAQVPRRLEHVREYVPLEVLHGSRLLTVVAGFLLLLLGHGLWRHKRRAWQGAVGLLGASTLLHIVPIAVHATLRLNWRVAGHSAEALAGNILGLVALVALRKEFGAGSDPPSFNRGLKVLAVSVGFACAYGTVGFYLLDREFHERFNLPQSLAQTLRLFFTFGGAPVPHTRGAYWFLGSLYAVSGLTLIYGAAAALRPVVYHSRRGTWSQERETAAAIAERYGASSLVRMTLFPDKTFFFPPGLDAYLAFRTVGNVAVVLGDPICAPEQVPSAISAFASYCAEMDWTPCYYQVLPDYLEAYRALGYQVLKIGEEGIIDLQRFRLAGAAFKDLRNAVNKLTKAGFEAKFWAPPIDEEVLRELREVSDDWLRHMYGREKRFSLGWFDPDYLRECDVEAIVSPEGRIEAFANYVTEYRAPNITPDLMRRRQAAPAGTMDFLFVRAAEHYRELGFQGLNLGLSPLAGVGNGTGSRMSEQFVRMLYEHFNRFYSFKGLHAFKSKFRPRWEPRFLVYSSVGGLPKAAIAVVRANNPGLVWWP